MGMNKKAKGSYRQLVWAGDTEALSRLIKQVEELASYARERLIARDREEEKELRQKFDETHQYLQDEDRKERAWQEEQATRFKRYEDASKVQLTVRLKRWSMELKGSLEEVLGDIDDVASVRMIEIGLARRFSDDLGGYDIVVRLGEDDVTANFEGPESHFIDLAGTRLKSQLQLQRPWYWWFRSMWLIAILVVPSLAAGIFVSKGIADAGAPEAVAFVAQFVTNLLVGFGGYGAAHIIVRPIELIKAGGKSRSLRDIGAVSAALGWIITTVVVPLLLNIVGK